MGLMKNSKEILEKLDKIVPNPVCELNYKKDYELLIATVLAAQSTDKRVNVVTKELFLKYDIFSLAKASIEDIENIIKPVGTYKRKSIYIIEIANKLVKDYNGKVPNDRNYLENLPGVGRKTCNVVLSNIYNVPTIAVDTHVARVSKRLELTKSDDVLEIEKDLFCFPLRINNRFGAGFLLAFWGGIGKAFFGTFSLRLSCSLLRGKTRNLGMKP